MNSGQESSFIIKSAALQKDMQEQKIKPGKGIQILNSCCYVWQRKNEQNILFPVFLFKVCNRNCQVVFISLLLPYRASAVPLLQNE